MAMDVRRPEALSWQVFRGSDAVDKGLLAPKALRGRGRIRLRYDVYADFPLERDYRLACQAAALVLPPAAVITGRSAALLHGVDHAASFADPVHVTVPRSAPLGPRNGLIVHRTDLEPADIERLEWCQLSTVARTAWDVAGWHDLVISVPIVDVMLRNGLVDPSDLEKLAARRDGRRGGRMAQRAVTLADGGAQSPPESVLRVRLVLKGLPVPVAQWSVALPSGVVFHPDLAWPEYKVAVEYDGLWHASADQFHRDRRRLNQLVAAGWIVLHVTSERMRSDFAAS